MKRTRKHILLKRRCMGKEQNMRTGNEFRNATRHILKAPHKSLKKWPLGRKLHECSLTISFYFDTLWKNMGFYYWCTSFIIWHTRVVKLVKNVFNEQKQIFLFFFLSLEILFQIWEYKSISCLKSNRTALSFKLVMNYRPRNCVSCRETQDLTSLLFEG